MARGINKAIIVGNTGNDPEIRYTANNSAVATVSIATSESWKDKVSGESNERTEWHRIVFNRLAEIVGEYVKKGSKLYIEGSLRTRKWQDQSGQDRYTTEIIANESKCLIAAWEGLKKHLISIPKRQVLLPILAHSLQQQHKAPHSMMMIFHFKEQNLKTTIYKHNISFATVIRGKATDAIAVCRFR